MLLLKKIRDFTLGFSEATSRKVGIVLYSSVAKRLTISKEEIY